MTLNSLSDEVFYHLKSSFTPWRSKMREIGRAPVISDTEKIKLPYMPILEDLSEISRISPLQVCNPKPDEIACETGYSEIHR